MPTWNRLSRVLFRICPCFPALLQTFTIRAGFSIKGRMASQTFMVPIKFVSSVIWASSAPKALPLYAIPAHNQKNKRQLHAYRVSVHDKSFGFPWKTKQVSIQLYHDRIFHVQGHSQIQWNSGFSARMTLFPSPNHITFLWLGRQCLFSKRRYTMRRWAKVFENYTEYFIRSLEDRIRVSVCLETLDGALLNLCNICMNIL